MRITQVVNVRGPNPLPGLLLIALALLVFLFWPVIAAVFAVVLPIAKVVVLALVALALVTLALVARWAWRDHKRERETPLHPQNLLREKPLQEPSWATTRLGGPASAQPSLSAADVATLAELAQAIRARQDLGAGSAAWPPTTRCQHDAPPVPRHAPRPSS